jgi:hypothetical protein
MTESPYCLQKWDNLRKQTFVSCFVGWKCPGYYIITTPTIGSWWSQWGLIMKLVNSILDEGDDL